MKAVEIGEKLRSAIKQSKHTKCEICSQLGIKRNALSRYLSGKDLPEVVVFANLCDYLKLDANEILGITEADKFQ